MKNTAHSFLVVTGFSIATRLASFIFKMWMSRSLGAEIVGVDGAEGRVHQLGQAHIDDVISFQVDLGRAASSLNDDDVHLFGQTVVGGKDVRDQ